MLFGIIKHLLTESSGNNNCITVTIVGVSENNTLAITLIPVNKSIILEAHRTTTVIDISHNQEAFWLIIAFH
jgi:hypothetical protein